MFRGILDRQADGASTPIGLQQQAGRSLSLVHRLRLDRKLANHEGCVNTVAFNPTGERLVSGSDDLHINIWDWQLGKTLLSFHSGHRNNVFQAKTLPESADKTIVTCAADGKVRAAFLSEDGHCETKQLAKHRGRAHKLALEPDQPNCFLSSGEDGAVISFDMRSRKSVKLLVCKTAARPGSQTAKPLVLNSIHCNPCRPWQFTVAGGDAYVRVYDRRKAEAASCSASADGEENDPEATTRSFATALATPVRKLAPKHMHADQAGCTARHAHVTCATFSRQGEIVATYNDEKIYLFGAEGTSQDRGRPRPASTAASSPAKRAKTSNQEADAAHDQQTDEDEQEEIDHRARRDSEDSGMAEKDSSSTSEAMDRWRDSLIDDEVVQTYSGHVNSETVKGVSFMGVADEYVVSGSDCGHVYIWSKHDGKLQQLLKGDRHVVNCLEPHPYLPATLATSGIEHDIKVWSPLAEKPQPPGPEAEELMSRNRNQVARENRARVNQVMLTPQIIAQLMRLQSMHQRPGDVSRRRAEARRGAGSDSGREGESEAEDGEEDEEPSSPRDAPDPRDCVIS
ncbi:hypothetical protein ABBQ38_010398 [Trebouxia sp. C0009 RCD-2024]